MSVLDSIDKVLGCIKNLKFEQDNKHHSVSRHSPVAQQVKQQTQTIILTDEIKQRREILQQARQRIRDSAEISKNYN